MHVYLWQLALIMAVTCLTAIAHGDHNFHRDFDVAWGKRNARFYDNGRLAELSLDEEVGSRIQSKNRYLYGRFDLEIKLVRGESAGTITSFYKLHKRKSTGCSAGRQGFFDSLASMKKICTGGAKHDEVDFEFLGNVTGEPYILHTNIYSNGKGEREQQFLLWFDPTEDFHTYSILWNPLNIILYIDGTPIRVFKNNEMYGVPFPTKQPVRAFASIWDAEDWATQGGRVKTDWSQAPFVASYRSYNLSNTCLWKGGKSAGCGNPSWLNQKLDWWSWMSLNWVRMNYMVYDYCVDRKRFPHGFPTECIIPIGKS